jgi:hypothetical protein
MARHDGGWLKLHRIPREHWLWSDHSARFLWWNLLSMATWKQTKLPGANGFEVIKPGTIITSRSELAFIMGDTENVVRRCLTRFRNDRMVAIKATKAGSVIYLVNWDKYQKNEEEETNDTTNEKTEKEPTDNQETTNRQPVSEECKNSKREPLGDKKICDDAPAIALPNGNQIFFKPESEIPDSDPYVAGSMPPESRNAPSNSIQTHLTTTDLVVESKSIGVDVSPVKNDLPTIPAMIEKPVKKKAAKKEIPPEEAAARSATRAAYIQHFEARYKTKPIVAAKENTQIKNLVASVGRQDSPFLVKFYLECEDEFLVNKAHPIGILASNPTEYMVRWKKGQTNRQTLRFGFGAKRPDARFVHQCMPEPDDGDDMLPWDREELEAKKLQGVAP